MMQFSMQLRYWHLEDWPSPYGARDEICYKGQQLLVVIAASYKGSLFHFGDNGLFFLVKNNGGCFHF